jgi:hypothetical protein
VFAVKCSRFIKLARFSLTLNCLAIVRLQFQIEIAEAAPEFFAVMSAKSALRSKASGSPLVS